MATIVELDGVRPTVGADVWLAPTAVLIGDVHVGDRASIWFGAVLRGDASRITVGARTSIQDNCVIHCADGLPTEIGEDVVVGHGSLLEGCVIEAGAVIGMGSIVLQRARVGAKAVLGAGAVLSERRDANGSERSTPLRYASATAGNFRSLGSAGHKDSPTSGGAV